MFIKRDLYDKLVKWKNKKRRKPLILQGARQVGKTSLVKYFGKKEFSDTAYFNFEEQTGLKQIFQITKDPKRIIDNLSILHKRKITPQKTLIIFDEIQECPEAINSLKYFKEKMPQYAVIGTGSLLGVSLAGAKSFPVGQVEFLNLYPLTFKEFLQVKDANLFNYLDNFNTLDIIPDIFFNSLREYLLQYLITGGLPEAVRVFIETKDLVEVSQILADALNSYQLDFSKHIKPSDIQKVNYIWQSLPSQLARENKKFIYSAAKKGARARDYENALLWLKQAGLINQVYLITRPALPLKAYIDLTAFKIYMFDVGILRQMSGLQPEVISFGDNLYTEFKGAIAENFILQSLKILYGNDIFYWTSGNRAEIDFLFQYKNKIIPVEVKADVNIRSKSLLSYAEKYNPDIKLRFSLKNVSYRNGLLNLPLFLVDYTNKFIDMLIDTQS